MMKLYALILLMLPLSAAEVKRPGTPRPKGKQEEPLKPIPPHNTKKKHKDAKKKNLSVVMEGSYTFRKLDY